ncbi:MAG: F0F1 ATP synthase subunit gamma, partial [Phycisphaerae bacterium]|nr:F0F1 ATP synthase subunit gamma [Phycisphaerae bacterium]
MAKARKIKARQKAVRSIHSVTRTMEMVATARYRKVHRIYTQARPYIEGLSGLLRDILNRSKRSRLKHPLLREPKYTGRRVLIVITSNRGLCGGYNAAVLQQAIEHHRWLVDDGVEVLLWVSGKRGISQMKHRGYAMAETITDFDGTAVSWRKTADMADRFLGEYLSGELGGVDIAFAEPVGAGGYAPVIRPLLPIAEAVPPKERVAEPEETDEDEEAAAAEQADEPSHARQ